MVKILITTIQVNLVPLGQLAQNSPELSLLKFFIINLPSQPFLGRHLGFHIFLTIAFLRAALFFYSLAVFGLD